MSMPRKWQEHRDPSHVARCLRQTPYGNASNETLEGVFNVCTEKLVLRVQYGSFGYICPTHGVIAFWPTVEAENEWQDADDGSAGWL
jgi:hypothetical protein